MASAEFNPVWNEWEGPTSWEDISPFPYPVEEGTEIDILTRNGDIVLNVIVGEDRGEREPYAADAGPAFWYDDGTSADIVGWRLSRASQGADPLPVAGEELAHEDGGD